MVDETVSITEDDGDNVLPSELIDLEPEDNPPPDEVDLPDEPDEAATS